MIFSLIKRLFSPPPRDAGKRSSAVRSSGRRAARRADPLRYPEDAFFDPDAKAMDIAESLEYVGDDIFDDWEDDE
jgi:hypothetical protein